MKKQLFTLLSIISLCLGTRAQVTVTLGSGTLTVLSDASSTPISSYYLNTHFQVVYTAAEISAQGGGAGNITKLGWYIQTASANLNNYTIKMAHTTATNSATHNSATLTTVYGPSTYNPVAGGFDLLTLTAPFNWDGVSNILIDVCITGAPYVMPYGTIRKYSNSISGGSRYVEDDNAGSNCGISTSSTNSYKPQISFEMAAATCIVPNSIIASGISTSTVAFSWSAPSVLPANGYNWIVVPANAGTTVTPVASGTVAAGTTNAIITGLSASTSYDFYVQSNCGAGDLSVWTLANFTTLCAPITVFPYTESFSASFPNCWAVSEGTLGASYHWETTVADASHGVAGPQSGTNFMRLNVFNAQTAYNTYNLSSPTFVLPAGPKQITYNYFLGNAGYKGTTGASGADPYPLSLQVSTDNGFTWVPIYNHATVNSVFSTTSSTLNWQSNTVILGAYTNQNVVFRFVSNSNYGSGVCNQGLDEIMINDAPACSAPTAITTTNTTGYTTNLSWTAPSTGTPINYIWEVRTSGAAGSGTLGVVATGTVVAPTSSVNVSGLSPSTAYSVYLSTDCGSSLFSTWTAPKTFTTGVSCPATSTIALSAITATSAVASWTAGGTENSWYVQYTSPITTATISSPSYTLTGLTPSTNYTISVKALCTSTNDSSAWVVNQFMTPCQPANITGVGSIRCGIGSTSLTATSSNSTAIIDWYLAPVSGIAISTGSLFVTPTISNTTTYYASAKSNMINSTGARTAPTASANTSPSSYGLVFDANQPFVLNSVKIYPTSTSTSNLVVNLTDNTGAVLQTATIAVPAAATLATTPYFAPYTATLGFNVPIGVGHKLMAVSGGNMIRESGLGGFPYAIGGYGAITSGYVTSTSQNYYYFYDWQISSYCESARIPVTATVTTPPVLALTTATTVCANVITPLTITSNVSDYDNYVWSPNTNLYTDAAATTAYTGGTATTVYYKSLVADTKMYMVNATNSSSGCANIANTNVMTDVPSILASANPSVICSSSTVSLNATTNAIITGTASVGTGTTTSASSPVSPFNGSYGGMKGQYLISANDLIAGGLHAGNLTSLSLDVTSNGAALQNFAISIGTTTLNAFASGSNIQTGLSSVYTTTLFTPVVGNNVFVFSTPFNWDGTSNIIVSTCWSNNNTSNVSSTVKTITTPYLSAQSWLQDNQTSSVICGLTGTITTGAGSTSSTRPQFIFGGQVNGQGAGNLSWTWNPGAINSHTAIVNPINSGTATANQLYTVTAVNPLTTCSNTATVSVTVNPVPVAVVAYNSTQCGYGVPTASVTGTGGTYNWYNAATSGTLVQSGASATYTTPINGTTTFYVSEKNANCEGSLTSVTVTVTSPDAISTAISSSTICPAQTVTLIASNTGTTNVYTYTWHSAPNNGIPTSVVGATTIATPTLSGVYVYSVTGTDGVCTAIATTSLNVVAPPTVIASVSPSASCSGDLVMLNAATGSVGSGLVSIGTSTALTSATAELTAFCNRRLSYRMQSVYTAAELTAAGLVAGNITSIAYNITTLGDDATNDFFTVKCGTTTVSAFTDFVSSTSFSTVFPAATYTHAVGVNTITFTTPYYWDGISNLVVEVSHDGIDVTNNARTYYTTTPGNTIVYAYDGTLTGTPSTSRLNIIFAGQTLTQSAGNLNWQWNPGAINSNTTSVNPTNTTSSPTTSSYTVTAVDPVTTCSNTSVVTVTVNPIPTVTATTSNSIVCAGSSATLQAGGATSYTWLPQGGQTAMAVVSPTSNTTYTVTGSSFGCTATKTLVLTSAPVPTLVATAASTTALCAGSAVVLNTNGTATTFTWAPTGGNSATATVTPNTNTTYTVTGSDGICSSTNTVSVNVIAGPAVTATSSNSLICKGESVVLTASTSATSYTWSSNAGGVTTMSVSVTPSVTTNYTVTANNGTCTSQASVSVNVNPCTGIEELTNNSVLVYPNPTNGMVNINVTNDLITNAKIEIYDAIGKLVVRETLTKEISSVNITKLEDGVYFFKIISNNQDVKIGKLIKQ